MIKSQMVILCRVVKDCEYSQAISRVSRFVGWAEPTDSDPHSKDERLDLFDASTVLAVMFDKNKKNTIDDLVTYRCEKLLKKEDV